MCVVVWSNEIQLNKAEINIIPEAPGVFKVFQSAEYPRYQGKTRILYIGASKESLRKEIGRLLGIGGEHTTANRIARISKRAGINVTVIYTVVNDDDPKCIESELLRLFEDNYWELPLLNSQRGYKRRADRHYRE